MGDPFPNVSPRSCVSLAALSLPLLFPILALSAESSPTRVRIEISISRSDFFRQGINEGNGNHTSPDGRFELELNDGSLWLLYSSDPTLEFFYISAQPNEPNK